MEIIWFVAGGVGTLLLRVGLVLYTCGLLRAKNSGGALLRHAADLCLASLAFWAVGIALLNPNGSAFFEPRFLFGLHGDQWLSSAPYVFFVLATTLFASGIVVGALSERTRFWPSLAPSVLLGGVLVPMLTRWCQSGWLTRLHFHDYAGASFIHLAAGCCALVGAVIVGPRGGKYNRDGSSNVIPGHNLPLAGTGVMLLLIAWVAYSLSFVGLHPAFQPGLIGRIALNVLLAAAAAGAASLTIAQVRYGKPDIYVALTGMLGGLVAITAGADIMTCPAAVLTGLLAGLIISWLLLKLDLVWKIDDPTGAIAIHGAGGAWGIVAAGLFGAVQGDGRFRFIGTQLLGLVVVAVVVSASTAVLFFLLKRSVALRSREEDEFDGLDLAEHDIGSYPDFQQNTIKSYHLREA